MMLKDVIAVRALENHRLFVRFEDGVEGEIDFEQLAPFDGVFAPLRDPQVLSQVRVNIEWGTIEWPCGADIDPIVLYSAVSGIPIPDYVSAGSQA
jgi:hypothetical protein